MINNVIFDFGGVLFDWNPRYLYRKILDSEYEIEDFLNNVCTCEWNYNLDKGVTFEENTQKLIKAYPEKRDLIEAYWKRWGEMINNEITGTVEIMKELRENNINLYGLTNMPTESYHYLMENYEFLKLFKDIVASGLEKVAKPDKRIYKILLQRNKLNTDNCLFIDDVQENIKAGEDIGIKGVRFTNPRDLKKKLIELGLV
ncbi:HAD family hydrolase [Pseudomonadota bacterium]